MAKKPSAKARKANEEAVRQSKLDEKYGKPLFSLTYDMNEYELARAANLYGPDRMKDIFNGAAILSLALLILVLVTMSENIVLTMALLVIAVITSSITTSWSRFATFLARKSTLGLMGEDNRRHIVVTEDKVVEEGPDDRVVEYLRLHSARTHERGPLPGACSLPSRPRAQEGQALGSASTPLAALGIQMPKLVSASRHNGY